MRKRVLAGGILRDLEFNSVDSLDLYIYKLEHDCVTYKILDRFDRSDGTVIIRILTSYNNADLIEL